MVDIVNQTLDTIQQKYKWITGGDIEDDTLAQRKYTFGNLVFPEDLSTSQQGHYIVININVPVWSNNQQRTYLPNPDPLLSPLESSKVDVLRFGGQSRTPGQSREFLSIPRFTKRIAKSIALFMPPMVEYRTAHDYAEVKLTPLMGQGIGAIIGAFTGGAITPNASGSDLAKLSRHPINPRIEVVYGSTALREFTFHFLFAPESEQESIAVQDIIYTLRYHSSPELSASTRGFTFIPPAEFDITFYNRGVENTNIPKINTCVLENVDVNYTPQEEWATFANGHPVSIDLALKFREVEIVHKKRVSQGF